MRLNKLRYGAHSLTTEHLLEKLVRLNAEIGEKTDALESEIWVARCMHPSERAENDLGAVLDNLPIPPKGWKSCSSKLRSTRKPQ